MKVEYSTRIEVIKDLTERIKNARDFVIEQKLDYSELGKLYYATRYKFYNLQAVSKKQSIKGTKLYNTLCNTIIAVDLCKMYCEDSTEFFKNLEVNEKLVNSFIDYQLMLDKRYNNKIQDYLYHKEAFESYMWAKVNEDDKKNGYDMLK